MIQYAGKVDKSFPQKVIHSRLLALSADALFFSVFLLINIQNRLHRFTLEAGIIHGDTGDMGSGMHGDAPGNDRGYVQYLD